MVSVRSRSGCPHYLISDCHLHIMTVESGVDEYTPLLTPVGKK